MTWGVLEDHQTPMPPGTVLLDDVRQRMMGGAAAGSEAAKLKKDGHVVLQPQPTDSVNDPLNWPNKRKVLLIFTLIVTGVAVGGMMGMLGTAGRELSERYHVTYPKLIQTMSPPGIASNAIALFFASAIAAVYGKRIGIVVGAFVMWINMLAGYWANSVIYYRNLGIVSGIFGAPGELLLGPIITDLIFVHQRGRLMALSAIVGVIGGDASHVIAGNIIARLGVKYLYIISFAIMTPFLFAIYFFVWETTFERPLPSTEALPSVEVPIKEPTSPISITSDDTSSKTTATDFPDDLDIADDLKKTAIEIVDIETIEDELPASEAPEAKPYSPPTEGTNEDPKSSTRQNLRIYRGRVTERSLIRSFLLPFPFMIFPSVVFSTIINGAFITWAIVSGIISHQVLLYEPYNLKPDTLAYIGLPGSIVSLIFAVTSGLSSDKLIQWMAHRNNGVYEPEYRLLLMIPAVLFSTIGFLLLGPLYESEAAVWKLVLTSLLFHVAGPFASSASVTYIFDTMQNTSAEAFVATSLFKHVFVFFTMKFVPQWYENEGPIRTFRTLAILNLATASLTIPMYIFGKRLRGAVSRNKILMAASSTTRSVKKG